MSFIDSVREFFRNDDEPFEASKDDVVEKFRERTVEEIEEASDRADELIEETDKRIEALESGLEEIKDYSDRDSIQAVEDVAENFYRDRKKLLNEFSASQEFEQHFKDYREFVREFNDVSRKEGVFMKRVEESSSSLSQDIQDLVDHLEEMSDFWEEDYMAVRNLDEVREAVEKIDKVESMILDLKEEKDELNPEDLKNDLEDKKEELDNLTDSEAWMEKESLEDKLEDLESRKESAESSLASDVAGLERGLKKLLYSIENSDRSFQGSRKVLEKLKDGDLTVDPVNELEEASEMLEEEELLEGRQLEKFKDSVRDLQDFSERKEEINDLKNEIERVSSNLEDFEVEHEHKRISSDITRLENDIDDREERIKEIDDRIEELRSEKKDRFRRLEEFTGEVLGVEASIHES